jgi:hypothetical protein
MIVIIPPTLSCNGTILSARALAELQLGRLKWGVFTFATISNQVTNDKKKRLCLSRFQRLSFLPLGLTLQFFAQP